MLTLNHRKFFSFILVFFLFFVSNRIYSSTASDVFKRHLNDIFIETGSYRGEGIQNALNAGFKHIYSIELAPHLYQHCCSRFAGNPRVHLYLGDSSVVLPNILTNIHEPVTFWLDGHYSMGDTAKGDTNTPLLNELKIISQHPINTHTILIDDVRLFETSEFDSIGMEKILNLVRAINPSYQIYFEDGYVRNDVLVAEVK